MVEEADGLERFNVILEDVRRACEKGGTPWIPEVILKHTSIFIPDLYKKVKLAFCLAYPNEYSLYMILGIAYVKLKVENEEDFKGVTLYVKHPLLDIEKVIFACNKIAGRWNC